MVSFKKILVWLFLETTIYCVKKVWLFGSSFNDPPFIQSNYPLSILPIISRNLSVFPFNNNLIPKARLLSYQCTHSVLPSHVVITVLVSK